MQRTATTYRRLLAGAAVAVVLAWAATAGSTTVLKMGLEGLVANSDRIVVGDVESIESHRSDGKIYTETTLRIREQWKGEDAESKTVTIRQPGGRVGDTVTRVYGMPDYRRHERIVAFLKQRPERAGYVITGLRQGKFSVAVGPDGSTEFVVPRLGDVQLLEPDPSVFEGEADSKELYGRSRLEKIDVSKLRSADPAPIHQSVIPLTDFRERVQKALGPSEGNQ